MDIPSRPNSRNGGAGVRSGKHKEVTAGETDNSGLSEDAEKGDRAHAR